MDVYCCTSYKPRNDATASRERTETPRELLTWEKAVGCRGRPENFSSCPGGCCPFASSACRVCFSPRASSTPGCRRPHEGREHEGARVCLVGTAGWSYWHWPRFDNMAGMHLKIIGRLLALGPVPVCTACSTVLAVLLYG